MSKRTSAHKAPAADAADTVTGSRRSIDDVRQAHTDALAHLATLKRAEPRDADAVLQQKLAVQALAAELAELEAAGETA